VVGKRPIVAIACDRRQISAEEQDHARVARKPFPEPARVCHPGAHQPRSQQLGLFDRRLGDRDDPGAQPPGTRRDRVSAAGIARCLERRLQQLTIRQKAAHPRAVCAGRLAAGLRPGRGCHRRPATRTFGHGIILSSVSEPGLDKTAEAAGDGFTIFQVYVRGAAQWVDDHVRRAIDKGYNAFCLTVDTDSYSRRARHRQTPPAPAGTRRRRPDFPGAV